MRNDINEIRHFQNKKNWVGPNRTNIHRKINIGMTVWVSVHASVLNTLSGIVNDIFHSYLKLNYINSEFARICVCTFLTTCHNRSNTAFYRVGAFYSIFIWCKFSNCLFLDIYFNLTCYPLCFWSYNFSGLNLGYNFQF